MSESVLLVLAITGSATFGAAGVLLGLFFGVRGVQRDEGRWKSALDALTTLGTDFKALRQEWAVTLENLDQLTEAVETKRRRIAASDSAAKRREAQQEQAAQPEPTPQEIRNQIRRGIPRIGGTR